MYETVETIKSDYPSLRLGHGKCVYELRPDITWDKGKVRRRVSTCGPHRESLFYIHSAVLWSIQTPRDESGLLCTPNFSLDYLPTHQPLTG